MLCLLNTTSAHPSDSTRYFPCDLGDTWFYYVQYSPSEGEYKTVRIDSVFSHPLGKLVYMSGDAYYRPNEFVVDSARGFIYGVYLGQDPDNIDSLQCPYHLDAQTGDFWKSDPVPSHNLWYGVGGLFDTGVFGVRKRVKTFDNIYYFLYNDIPFDPDTATSLAHDPVNWYSTFQEDYAYGIGLTYRTVEPFEGWFLIGAILDGDSIGTILDVKGRRNSLPRNFSLSQNYPNPFNPSTLISYKLAASSDVTLKVYDVLGREVATLVHERQTAGTHSVTFNAADLPSGVYFYSLQAGTYSNTKKLLLLK